MTRFLLVGLLGPLLSSAALAQTVQPGGPAGPTPGLKRFLQPGAEHLQHVWVTNDQVVDAEVRGSRVYLAGDFDHVGPLTGPVAALDVGTGEVLLGARQADGEVYAIESDGAGGWYMGGDFGAYPDPILYGLIHLREDGSLAQLLPSHMGGIRALHRVGTTLYVGGDFPGAEGLDRPLLLAIDLLSNTITSWAPTAGSNPGSFDAVYSLASSGNTLYVAGDFEAVFQGKARRHLMAVDLTTGDVLPWAPEPNFGLDEILVSNGTLFAGGWFDTIAGAARSRVAAFDLATGALDPFAPALDKDVTALCRAGDTLYVGGRFDVANGQPRTRLAAFDLGTGALLPWAPEPEDYTSNSIAINSLYTNGNRVWIAGEFFALGGARRRNVGAVHAVSGVVSSWQGNAAGGAHRVHVVRGEGATVAIAGDIRMVGAKFRPAAAELDLVTGEATDWAPFLGGVTDPSKLGRATEIEVGPHGVYVGGEFGFVNGIPRRFLALVDKATGAVEPLFDAGLTKGARVESMLLDGERLYVSGDFETPVPGYTGTVALDAASGLVLGNFKLGAGQEVDALSRPFHSDALFVCGPWNQIGDPPVTRQYVAALDPETAAPLPWSITPSDKVKNVALVGKRLYLGGEFLLIDGQLRRHAAAVDAQTGSLLAWDPEVEGGSSTVVNAVTEVGGLIYLGGYFDTVGPDYRENLAAVDPLTGTATAWAPGSPGNDVEDIAGSDQYLVVVGQFESMNGLSRPYVAAFELTPE